MQKTEIFEIWRLNKPRIISSIRKKVKREHDIDDISQEVFIKFWIKNKEIKNKDKILHWLYRVTRFTIADYYRKKENSIDLNLTQSASPPLIENSEHKTDESKKLIPIIYSLPVKYKSVLIMSDIYELSHKEIAQQFEISVSCVKTRVVRARKLLAERMHECCSFSYDKYGNIIYCDERQAYYDCLIKEEKKS
jgi:RNA polymerase sigma-70 factor (ECF subfamily)